MFKIKSRNGDVLNLNENEYCLAYVLKIDAEIVLPILTKISGGDLLTYNPKTNRYDTKIPFSYVLVDIERIKVLR